MHLAPEHSHSRGFLPTPYFSFPALAEPVVCQSWRQQQHAQPEPQLRPAHTLAPGPFIAPGCPYVPSRSVAPTKPFCSLAHPHSSTLSTHTQRENGAPRPSLLPALSTVCVLPPRPARFACMCALVLTLLMSLLVSVTSLNTHQVPCSEGLNEEMLLRLLSPTPS